MAVLSALTWLLLFSISFTTNIPLIKASENSNEEHPNILPPSQGCKNMALWRDVYGLCIDIFSDKDADALWLNGDRFSLIRRVSKPVLTDYGGFSTSARRTDDATTKDLVVSGNDNFVDSLPGNDNGNDFLTQKRNSVVPTLREDVMRTRRQHSLSLNSALVSIADMLLAKDYNRKQARQKDFRQQLLGLGR
ncbi:uncharacterized protein LOC143290890 [Babylonia areolata]|uniref:uncharacterized protein LOC143290890 n=1 Tax=Babylonia areolata TaxID=304850 RepID=UPI003FD198A3